MQTWDLFTTNFRGCDCCGDSIKINHHGGPTWPCVCRRQYTCYILMNNVHLCITITLSCQPQIVHTFLLVCLQLIQYLKRIGKNVIGDIFCAQTRKRQNCTSPNLRLCGKVIRDVIQNGHFYFVVIIALPLITGNHMITAHLNSQWSPCMYILFSACNVWSYYLSRGLS